MTRLLARWLIAVLLATVLSPSFGWQALEGMAPHEHGDEVAAVHAIDGQVIAEHSHEGCPGHDQAAVQDTHDGADHCCPGHVLGHLLGGVGADGLFVAPKQGHAEIDQASDSFRSRIPEGLERPPRSAA